MKDYGLIALELHEKYRGKIEIKSKVPLKTKDDLSIYYTPGVAKPCLEIANNSELSYKYTNRGNQVAVISDGTAVLGLGNIGPYGAMPVMEGKAILFKEFAGIDAIPLCIGTNDVDEIVRFVKLLEPSFGGINLEDIKAPNCFYIEKKLKEICTIPIFHDDQHGTAVVTLAGIFNALKIVNKNIEDLKVVINGAGAAGISICKLLKKLGVKNLNVCDSKGIISKERKDLNDIKIELLEYTNLNSSNGGLKEAIIDSDIFIGVSAPGVLNEDMIKTMARDPIIFAMANPTPEIMPELALRAGARIVCTGRSDFPNQVNNVLAFPGILRGALDSKAKDINEEMKIAAAIAIAELVTSDELSEKYVIPSPFNINVAKNVARKVQEAAIKCGIIRT